MAQDPSTPPADPTAAGNSAHASGQPPTEPAAQTPAAPTTTVDADAIAAKVRDSLFAELRKAGVFGKAKPAPAPAPTEATPQQTQAPQPDPIKLRALDRALTKAGLATALSQSQYERAERAFAMEAPDDADGWVSDYFAGWKGAQTAPPTAPQPVAAQPAAPPKPQNERPVSDRGAPPPSQVPLEEADIVTMSETDRNALIKQKGLRWYREKLASQLKGRPVALR